MTLDYGNYGIILILGNAGFVSLNPKPSTVEPTVRQTERQP